MPKVANLVFLHSCFLSPEKKEVGFLSLRKRMSVPLLTSDFAVGCLFVESATPSGLNTESSKQPRSPLEPVLLRRQEVLRWWSMSSDDLPYQNNQGQSVP